MLFIEGKIIFLSEGFLIYFVIDKSGLEIVDK